MSRRVFLPTELTMQVECSWCGETIKAGTGEVGEETSHGICPPCALKVLEEDKGSEHHAEATPAPAVCFFPEFKDKQV